MHPLSLDELEARSAEVEDVLDATPDVDPWCSGPDWVLPVHAGFGSDSHPLLLASEVTTSGGTSAGYALLSRYRLADGRAMIAGLEPLWGFACPVLGGDIDIVAGELAGWLAKDPGWDVLVLPGVPRPDDADAFTARLVRAVAGLGRVGAGDGITRQVARLDCGYDTWLSGRSSRFRRNLRQAQRRAEADGVEVVDASADDDAFDRVLAIEAQSWKGAEDGGITTPEMSATYRAMVSRLQARGRLRLYVARRDGADIGYILGGVRQRRYRGLQLSYTADAASLSVGNLLQRHQIEALCASGEAAVYDLGMDLDYKRRWADHAVTTFTLVVERERP